MILPQELLSQFAKITKDETKVKTEKIVYGTIVEEDDIFYVQFDGSDLLTPMTTTVDVQNGDRVSAMIKNHMVVVTGNISSPAARATTVQVIIEDLADVEEILTTMSEDMVELDKAMFSLEEDMAAMEESVSTIEKDNTDIKKKLEEILDLMYPIGAIYLSVNEVDPASLFGGSWERIKDAFLLGYSETYPLGSIGGEATHALTVDEMPTHEHTAVSSASMTGGGDGTDVSYILEPTDIGGGQAHNNMPPYLAVNMWKRIA